MIAHTEIMTAAKDAGFNISAREAADWAEDVEGLPVGEAWNLIWRWIEMALEDIEADGREAQDYEEWAYGSDYE